MKLSRQPPRVSLRAKIKGRIAAFIFALLIVGISLASTAAAQTTTTAQQQADNTATAQNAARSKSTVRGRVVYDDTNRPLRRVRVSIYDPSSRDGKLHRMAWTDVNGEFILKNVVAGKYYVTADAPGIIKQVTYDSDDDMSDVATVSVNGTNSAEVKVRVRRGAVISGKVTYSDGEPAINAMLSIRRKKDGQMLPVYVSEDCGMGVKTDERGVYRVSGLPPGEYVVGAGEQKMSEGYEGDEEGRHIDRAVLGITYYEGATSARSATPIQVEAGSETNNINITFVDRGAHKISGTLTMRGTGSPVTQARISLVSKNESNDEHPYFENQTVSPDAQGRWSIDEVLDDTYTIIVAPMMEYQRHTVDESGARRISKRTPPVFLIKRQDVTIAGNDVTGLAIEVSGGGRVSGTVMVEGGKPLPPNITIYPETAHGERRILLSPSTGRVQPDGTFTVDGMPSDGVWIKAVSQQDNKYYTKSATANGVDLLQEPLIVKDGEEVKGVRVVISPEVATLTGRVLVAEGGAPARGASVMLVPAEPHKQRLRTARLYGLTNPDGGFTLTSAPGEYVAVVMRAGGDPDSLSDEAVKARAAGAQRVTLHPAERKNMDFIAPVSKK